MRREKHRDDRDFDTTQLRETGHGQTLGRDYSAHFFRWSFARRYIGLTDKVLEIGCGQDKPLSKILTGGAGPRVKQYVGCDLNRLKLTDSQRLTFLGEFNFVERWREVRQIFAPFDVAVHLEVIEHMLPKHGDELLHGCFECLRPGGIMLMSTPCYDGVRHAANHIHEYTIQELATAIRNTGFEIERRFGTFMDIKWVKKLASPPIQDLAEDLSEYYDNDALACFFAPMFPDHARNNLWVCQKP